MATVPMPFDVLLEAFVPVMLRVKLPALGPAVSVKVAEAVAPEARPVSDTFENAPVKPAGCVADKLNEAAVQADELLFFNVTVKPVEEPEFIETDAGATVTVGFAMVHAAATVILAVAEAVFVDLLASVAVAVTLKVPVLAPAVSVNVTDPLAPPARVSDAAV